MTDSPDTRVWVLNASGSDGAWNVHEWEQVEDDIRDMCSSTVDDCEQEINEGGHFASDEVRDEVAYELGSDVFSEVIRQLSRSDTATVEVVPWYAVNQRCTWTLTVKLSTFDEVYA